MKEPQQVRRRLLSRSRFCCKRVRWRGIAWIWLAFTLLVAEHSLLFGAQPASPAKSSSPEVERAAEARMTQLAKKMDELYAQNKMDQAIPLAEELVAHCRKYAGEQSAETAFALHQLAVFHFATGSFAVSKSLNEDALAIRRVALGNEHQHTALSLCNLANALVGLGKYEEALVYQLEALEIFRKVKGETSTEVAQLLHSCGTSQIHGKTKDNTVARSNFEQALAIRRKILGDNHPDTAETLLELGKLAGEMGDKAQAREFLDQAAASYKTTLHKNIPRSVGSLLILGHAYQLLGDLAAEQACYEQALAIRKNLSGDDHFDTVEIRLRLASVSVRRGDFLAAIPAYRQSLASYRRALSEWDPRIGVVLAELANMHFRLSEFAIARSYCEEALPIIGRAHGEQDVATLNLRILLATSLAKLGESTAATAQFKQALAIRSSSLPEVHEDTAQLYHGLGMFLIDLGRLGEARKYLERVLAIRKQISAPTIPSEASLIALLRSICISQRDFVAASSYSQQALALRQQMLLPADDLELAQALNDMGFTTACVGDADKAQSYFEQSLEVNGHLGIEGDPLTADVLINMATLAATQGDLSTAAAKADQSRQIVQRHLSRQLSSLSEGDQLLFLSNNDRIVSQLALSIGVSGGTNPKIAADSAGWLLNSKGLAQEALAKRAAHVRESSDPRLRELADRLQAVRAAQARWVLSATEYSPTQSPFNERARLAQEEESLSRQIAQAGGATTVIAPWIPLENVRGSLAPGEVFINISRFRLRKFEKGAMFDDASKDYYVAWIIPPTGKGRVQIVVLGDAMSIDEDIIALRVAINSMYTIEQSTGRVKALDERAYRLFNLAFGRLSVKILHPLVQQIGTATELTISPDAGLWLVPWSALLLSDGRFAVEKYQIRHLVSGRELVAPRSSVKAGRPMIVANPDFDLDPEVAQSKTMAVLGGGKISDDPRMRASQNLSRSRPIAAPLPGFEKQVNLVTPSLLQYAGKKPAIFKGQNALEGLVKAVHSPQVLLLATHGFFDPNLAESSDEQRKLEAWAARSSGVPPPFGRRPENPLLHCGVLLAGCNQRELSKTDDGILTGIEIASMDLRGTELVVLSACDTGVGEVRVGEGVAGIQQAFQIAGAEAVVATLWPVFVDEATQEMNDFFRGLAVGQSKTKSLRGAQLEAIRRLKNQHGVAPPLLWAGFTITGR